MPPFRLVFVSPSLSRRSGLEGPGPRPTSRAPRSPATLGAPPVRFRKREKDPGWDGGGQAPISSRSSVPSTRSPAAARASSGSHTKNHRATGAAAVSPADTHTQRNEGAQLGPNTWFPKRGHKCASHLPWPADMSLEFPQHRREHQPGRGCRTWSALGPRGAGRATAESATGRDRRAGTCQPTAQGPRWAARHMEAPAPAASPPGRCLDSGRWLRP